MKSLKCGLFSRYRSEIYGLSIVWIMLFHTIVMLGFRYDRIGPVFRPVQFFLKYGNMGCEIFLFCSGIGLYYSFMKDRDPGRYVKRRLSRLFWPVLIIDGWYWVWLHLIIKWQPSTFLTKLSMLQFWFNGDQQIWFLSTILLLYLLAPYLLSVMEQSRHRILLTALLAAGSGLLLVAFSRSAPDYYKLVEIGLTRIPVFLMGLCFGKTVYEKKELPVWVYGISALMMLSGFWVLRENVLHGCWRRFFYLLPALGVLGAAVGLLSLIPKENPVLKIAAWCGSISLELYLSHVMLYRIYRSSVPEEGRHLWHLLLLIPLSFAVAAASSLIYRRILRPLLKR